jgi:hypothetical protein
MRAFPFHDTSPRFHPPIRPLDYAAQEYSGHPDCRSDINENRRDGNIVYKFIVDSVLCHALTSLCLLGYDRHYKSYNKGAREVDYYQVLEA